MKLTDNQATSLKAVISEIVLRCVTKVCLDRLPPPIDKKYSMEKRIEEISRVFEDALIDVVILCENGSEDDPVVLQAVHWFQWDLLNRILNEIEKEIPVAKHIEVVGRVSRSQGRAYGLTTPDGD